MKLAISRELHAYWNALRRERSAPERSEIDPSAIRGVLADTFILGVDRAGRYPVRVVGSRTNALFLTELKDRAFIDLWRDEDRREVGLLLASVSDEAAPVLAGASIGPRGMRPLELEVLLLPLRHHGATHSRILGACAPTSMPTWIGLLPTGLMHLLSFRVLGPAEYQTSEADAKAASEAAPTSVFGAMPQVQRRGHLLVFTGSSQRR